jgi:predicted Zn-dependent protease
MGSWSRLTDRKALSVKPLRIDMVTIDRAMDIGEFQRRYPSDIEVERLALMNQVDLGETMKAGRQVKRVRGFDPGPMMGVTLR